MFRVDIGVINLHLLWGNWGKLFKAGGIGNEPWRMDNHNNINYL